MSESNTGAKMLDLEPIKKRIREKDDEDSWILIYEIERLRRENTEMSVDMYRMNSNMHRYHQEALNWRDRAAADTERCLDAIARREARKT